MGQTTGNGRSDGQKCTLTCVGLLQNYSDHDLVGLRRLAALIDTTPKRPLTGTNPPARPHRLDRRLSPDAITDLVATYRSGTSTNELCRRYGVSNGGVLKILADHGIAMRYQPMTEREIDRAITLYVEEGLSIRAIAHQLGKSKGSVWKALHERGIMMRAAH